MGLEQFFMNMCKTVLILCSMDRYVGIGEAAQFLGVSISTLRRWCASGRLSADYTVGGHRRYDLAKLRSEKNFFSGRARYPQYRKKGVHDSFILTNDQFTIEGICGDDVFGYGVLWFYRVPCYLCLIREIVS